MSIERAALEAELKHVKEQLASLALSNQIMRETLTLADAEFLDEGYSSSQGIRKKVKKALSIPTSTAHLEAVKAQVWNEAIEEAARICRTQFKQVKGGLASAYDHAEECAEAILLAKKG